MEEQYSNSQYPRPDIEDDEIDLLDLLLVLVKNKWLILGITFLFACVAIVASLTITPIYKASTSFIQSPTGTVLSSKLVANISKNTQILDAVIEKFNLKETYNSSDIATTRRRLRESMSIQDDSQSGLMSLSILGPTPDQAATIANFWIEVLQAQLRSLHKDQLTIITTQRESLKKELDEAQNLLSEKTKALGTYFEQINMPTETEQELQMLKSNAEREASPLVLKELPDGGAEYMLRIREIRTAESQYLLLLDKFNNLRNEEMRQPTIIQVIQQALPPDQRLKPRRSLMVTLAAMLGLFVGVFIAFIREFIYNAKKDPERANQIAAIRKSLTFKR
jgi:tyrosine-protein kinase Etk/Wzc